MTAPDYLNMSDEDLLNHGTPVGESAETVPETTESLAEDGGSIDAESQEQEQIEEVEANTKITEKGDADDGVSTSTEETSTEEGKTTDATTVDVNTVKTDVDYRKEYERLLTPFKANGKDITIKNVDDAVALMQMGANYNKKMAALKPNLKLLKMLENNQLLDEEKISYLIDLGKKNPDAINKLVKDSGIDPMDLDTNKADAYRPQSHRVDDKEMELDAVLNDIEDTPTYSRTLDVIGNKWDEGSKKTIINNPSLVKVINDHMQSGIYDLITKEVESDRVFGRLNGMSDIDAYRQVGDTLQARGGFDHLFTEQGQQLQPGTVVATNKPSGVVVDRLKEKKRAASPSKPSVTTGTSKEFNPLELSDEAFEQLIKEKYL